MENANHTKSVIDLLAGRVTSHEIAAAHGVDESVVLAWKALYLDGASASLEARAAKKKPARARGREVALLTLGLAFVSTASWVGYARSQTSTCTQTLPSPLVTFCAGAPARASQVNGNFQQLVNWVQAKIGPVAAAGISTPSLTVAAGLPITMSDDFGAESGTSAETTMTPMSRSACYLTHTSVLQHATYVFGAHPTCTIRPDGNGSWELFAGNTGTSATMLITCHARCISW